MCGFVGFIAGSDIKSDRYQEIIQNMTDTIALRGPDDSGLWFNSEKNLVFGFRRLAIQDLSEAGHQPMHSSSKKYTICFNGEIYNHLEMREALQKESTEILWRGHSDTETILCAIDHWGIERTLKSISGMFALSIWDRDSNLLTLARDRFGEKPLYFGWVNNSFIFGSQLKAFKTFPYFNNPISKEALSKYLRFNYVPAPFSIYEDIFKLEPGCYVQIETLSSKKQPASSKQYWSLQETIRDAKKDIIVDEEIAVKTLKTQLEKSVSQQMLSDVPLGAFLSGGVDSSLIVSIMQSQASSPIKTFTIGFDDADYDESKHAKKIAEYLGTDHQELIVTAQDAQEVIALLPDLYDEPFADSSQIPTYLVSRLAKQKVTVALSGDAGDELFAGYNRYFWGPRVWKNISWLPHFFRRALSRMVYLISVNRWNQLGSIVQILTRGFISINRMGDKAYKFADRLRNVKTIADLYLSLVTQWDDPSFLIRNFDQKINDPVFRIGSLNGDRIEHSNLNEMEKMMYLDTITYLPDDILCKVDRASMGVSLETRVPFLDPKIVDIAWRIDPSLKTKNGISKSLLKELLYTYVPKGLLERPKSGFGVPVGDWIRGDLRGWATDLLSKDRIEADGIFNFAPIDKLWKEHLSCKRDWTHKLWSILMFQAWLHHNKK